MHVETRSFYSAIHSLCGGPGNHIRKLSVFFCKVSVPMELRLTVKKAGSTRGEGPETQGQWQQLRKVIRKAHRPVVFEVGGLIPDTRCGTQPSKRHSPRISGTPPILALVQRYQVGLRLAAESKHRSYWTHFAQTCLPLLPSFTPTSLLNVVSLLTHHRRCFKSADGIFKYWRLPESVLCSTNRGQPA